MGGPEKDQVLLQVMEISSMFFLHIFFLPIVCPLA